jgi:hypothetical protein
MQYNDLFRDFVQRTRSNLKAIKAFQRVKKQKYEYGYKKQTKE